MAIDRKRKIAARHAAAVVGDADPAPPTAIGEDVDPAGARVDRVLDQLLDHARGAFDHLAGGNAVDELFGKLADGHGGRCRRRSEPSPILEGRAGKCMGWAANGCL